MREVAARPTTLPVAEPVGHLAEQAAVRPADHPHDAIGPRPLVIHAAVVAHGHLASNSVLVRLCFIYNFTRLIQNFNVNLLKHTERPSQNIKKIELQILLFAQWAYTKKSSITTSGTHHTPDGVDEDKKDGQDHQADRLEAGVFVARVLRRAVHTQPAADGGERRE